MPTFFGRILKRPEVQGGSADRNYLLHKTKEPTTWASAGNGSQTLMCIQNTQGFC
jgi:hypothetical protein